MAVSDESTTATTDEGLVRAIGSRELALNIINMTVGAGIFVLPGVVAAGLGPAAILAYLVCAVAVALVFLCFAEAGSRVTRSGGAYAYIEEAFGPFAGFVSSILLWFGWGVLGDAAIGVALVDTMAIAIPWLGAPLGRAIFLIVLYGGVAYINVVGVKAGVRFSAFNTVAKLIPLVVLVMIGVFAVQSENLVIDVWPEWSSIGAGALILVFAFGGAEIALSNGGEIVKPERTVPKGLVLGIGSIFILYLAIHGVAQGVLGLELARNAEAPLVATGERAMGSWGRGFLLVGTGISMLGVVSADLLASPRVVFAAARDRLLPSVFARVHPRYKTPYVAVLFYTGLALGFALTGAFKTLAVVGSGSLLTVYLGTSLAVLQLRRKGLKGAPGVFRVPGGPIVPALSACVVGWLLSSMTAEEAVSLVALVGIGCVLYIVTALSRSRGGSAV